MDKGKTGPLLYNIPQDTSRGIKVFNYKSKFLKIISKKYRIIFSDL